MLRTLRSQEKRLLRDGTFFLFLPYPLLVIYTFYMTVLFFLFLPYLLSVMCIPYVTVLLFLFYPYPLLVMCIRPVI
jgi:hypothetical protein